MCGIAGFVTLTPQQDSAAVLSRMTEALYHRGPDAHGYYRDAYASLGHRRLSIIDLTSGQQPMCNEDGNLWITYNGEIFNHADLRPALEQAGHRYKSHCDTETILHAYEQYGPECLSLFRECSPLPSGTSVRAPCSAPATVWEKSRSTTIGTAACSPSPRRSSLFSSIRRFLQFSKRACFRSISTSAIPATSARCSRASGS